MKALFVGLGGVGQRHMRNLLRLRPGCAIGAMRRRDRRFEIGDDLAPDHSVDIVEKYRIHCCDDLAEAIAWGPDLAVVANPTSLHVATALPLLAAGIPILLEKPVSHDRAGALDLLAAQKRTGVPVMAAFVLRFHPLTRKLLEWADAGAIGRPLSVQVTCHHFLPFSHSFERMDEFYLGRRDLGGGVVLSEIHSLDLLHRLFGMPERLWCSGGRLADYPGDVEDTVSALMEFRRADGCVMPVTLHMSLVERPAERRLTIHGERGRIDWAFQRGEVVLEDFVTPRELRFTAPATATRSMYVAEMQAFLDWVERGIVSDCALDRTMGSQMMAAAMLETICAGGGAVGLEETRIP